MMTQLNAIIEAGQKAAQARRVSDESAAQFHTNWANKAIRLEENPSLARNAFQSAYREYNAQFDR